MSFKTREYFKRLDQVAEKMNVWLFMIAIGLAALTVVVYIAEMLPPPPLPSTINMDQNGPTPTDRRADVP